MINRHTVADLERAAVEVVGDDTGATECYVHTGSEDVLVADDAAELLEALDRENRLPLPDPIGISHLLCSGFVPQPLTALDNVAFLSIGQQMTVDVREGRPVATHRQTHPYRSVNSRGDSRPDAGRLLELITAAVVRSLADTRGSGILMLSAGKDSTAIALALAEAGIRDVECVTYRRTDEVLESEIAAAHCRRLGLPHRVVEMPPDDRMVGAIDRFFAETAQPVTDLALLAYVFTLDEVAAGHSYVIDGGGNDFYMGYVASRTDRLKQLAHLRGRAAGSALSATVPVHSRLNYLARSRASSLFPLRTMRYRELRAIYPEAVDVEEHWSAISRQLADYDRADLANATFHTQIDPTSWMRKVRLSAAVWGLDVKQPYCDAELIDYYFNLPRAHRFDEAAFSNKVLLRKLLRDRLDYDDAAIGKIPFRFDSAGFLGSHRDLVLSEIVTCRLWSPGIEAMATRWMNGLGRHPRLTHVLVPLFQVSAWHNRSRFAGS